MSMASILGLTSGKSSNNMCYLQWWRRRGGWLDGNEGLLHQLSSLGVALAEAHYLRRTMVLPTEEFCLPGKHTQHVAGQTIATTFNSSATCFDYDELFDLELLSKFVRVVRPSQLPKLDDSSIAQVIGTAKSEEMHARYPCGARHAVLLRRETNGFWFMRSLVVNGSTLRRHLLHSMGALGIDSPAADRHWIQEFLRSGLFYAPRIKAAAREIATQLGGAYMAVHLRRGDRLTDKNAAPGIAPIERVNMTRPDALMTLMSESFPRRAPVYIGTTEPLSFFQLLRSTSDFPLYFSANFSSVLHAHNISNNALLFAVENLIFLGAAKFLETFRTLLGGFFLSCFPATNLRAQNQCDEHALMRGSAACNLIKHGVRYGGVCVRQKLCSLVPPRCFDHDSGGRQLRLPSCADVSVNFAHAPMNVALLLCGLSRGAFAPFGTWQGIERHVVRPLSAEACVMSFVCDEDSLREHAPTEEIRSKLHIVHEHYARTLTPMERLRMCWTVQNDWAQQRGVNFRFLLKARPDQKWHADVPPLSTLPTFAVSVRARVLATARFDVTADHMSWIGCGWDQRVCPLQAHRALDVGLDCVMVDDQWAVIPVQLAKGYFNGSKVEQELSTSAVRESSFRTVVMSRDNLARCGSCFQSFAEGELTAQLSAASVPVNLAPFRIRMHSRFGEFELPPSKTGLGQLPPLSCSKNCTNQPTTPCHSRSRFTRSVEVKQEVG